MKVDSSKRGTPWMPCVAMLILSSFAPVIYAQTTTTYSYDNLKHLVGATSSSGSGFQYQYDANGNLTNVTSSAPNAIAFATPVDVELSRPGQSASLTFTATAGQSYTLNANSISAMPSMGSLTISVYNAAGTLVGSELAGSTASISLPNLPAGTYSVVIAPPTDNTGSLELMVNATQTDSIGTTDGPIPMWAYVVLGVGLIMIGRRNAVSR